jgi:hypothetical protein
MVGPFKMKTTISRKILNAVNGVGVPDFSVPDPNAENEN